eukprot:1220047-Alexandrium_andersonii.AAC.1
MNVLPFGRKGGASTTEGLLPPARLRSWPVGLLSEALLLSGRKKRWRKARAVGSSRAFCGSHRARARARERASSGWL